AEMNSRCRFALSLIALVSSVLASSRASAQCAPIPPGQDAFPSTGKIVLELLPPVGIGTPEVIRLGSSGLPLTLVHRNLQIGDSIATELTQLELTGVGAIAGSLALHEDPSRASVGRIDHVVQNPQTCALVAGESSFDLFVTVDVPSIGATLYNPDPIRILGP